MPFLKIQTNHAVDPSTDEALLAKASKLVAKELGKPESYVMVQLQKESPMLFAGSNAPLAYLELKSIGLPNNSTTSNLSNALCTLMEQELSIPKDRIYIEFADALVLYQGHIMEFSTPEVFRGKTQCAGNGPVLVKQCNAVAGHHRSAQRVGLSTPMTALRLLQRTGPFAARRALPCTLTDQLNPII